jgi:hypothetical protein
MTLVELLVGSIMAFLIITPMLAFVVDMLNTDRREQVKSNTEQDIQAAVDFIAQDLSQAIHIYDNNTTTGIPELIDEGFIPTGPDRTPILVFWKREIIRSAIPPVGSSVTQPANCPPDPPPAGQAKLCNDSYVLSLVAYYQVRENLPSIWCQPSGSSCPTRIARYQIKSGLENTKNLTTGQLYTQFRPDQERDEAYNAGDPANNEPPFDITRPELNVTTGADNFDPPDVLVNYIDHTPKQLSGNECTAALGNPTVTSAGGGSTPIGENTLIVTESPNPTSPTAINSFYACVDTARNIARVTIRGNSLRRLQNSNVPSSSDNSAFFPTASVQVQGRGALGQ